MTTHLTLRDANAARQIEWDAGGYANNSEWRMTEMGGETGEVLNVLKKLHRERCGVKGSRATKDDLAEELADVVICLDLLLMTGEFRPVETRLHADADDSDLTEIGVKLYMAVSRLFTVYAFKDPIEIDERAKSVLRVCKGLASRENINLAMAVENKFNATSRNVGLYTRLKLI